MQRSIVKAGVFAFVVALGCASDSTATPGSHTLANITVSLSASTLTVGRTAQATVSLLDETGAAYEAPSSTISWSSSNGSIASVSSSGLITAASAGNAVITASILGKSATAALSVVAAPPASVANVVVSLDSGALHVGNFARANAVVKDSAGNLLLDRQVSWSTSNPIVATVSGLGIVSGVAAGSASISANSEGRFGSAALTVLSATAVGSAAPNQTVALALGAASIPVGGTTSATAILRDTTGAVIPTTDATLWSSSDETVATVASNGTISAVAAGTAAITAMIGKASGTTVIVAMPPTPATVASVTVVVSSPLTIGTTATAVAIPKDSAGHALTGRSVSWISSAPSVATISISGVVTPISNGTTTITATVSGKSGTAAVNVGTTLTATAVTVTVDSSSLAVGHVGHATAFPRDASGTPVGGKTATWTSSNTSAVTVASDGSFSAVAAGTADITANVGGITGKATVSVGAVLSVATVTVSFAEGPTIAAPYVAHASAVLKSATGTVISGPVTWSTSNVNVASVNSSGVVTAVNPGTASISAGSGSKVGSATVTVTSTGPTDVLDPEPVYTPGMKVMFQDNLDSYGTWADAVAKGWLATSQKKTQDFTTNPLGSEQLLSGGRGGGGKALRLAYDGVTIPAGGQEGHSFNRFFWLPGDKVVNDSLAGKPGHTFYMTYWFKVTPGGGFSLDQDYKHILQLKWLELWSFTYGNRAQFSTQYQQCGRIGGGKYGQVIDGQGTNWGFYGNAGGHTKCQALQIRGPWAANGTGDWHRVTYKYKTRSSATALDGTAQMWYDGVLIVSVDPRYCGLAVPGGLPIGTPNPPHWCETEDLQNMFANDFVLSLNWGGVSATYLWPFTLDFDDFIAWREP